VESVDNLLDTRFAACVAGNAISTAGDATAIRVQTEYAGNDMQYFCRTKLDGGLQRLHTADKAAVDGLVS